MKFAAESPLGKLAKRLRMLGFDTIYEQDVSARDFAACLKSGERILLTRRQRFLSSPPPGPLTFVVSNDPDRQIREILRTHHIRTTDICPFQRCLRCNGVIRPIEAAQVAGRVPDYVLATQSRFTVCAACGRIYWPGTHLQRALARIENWLDGG